MIRKSIWNQIPYFAVYKPWLLLDFSSDFGCGAASNKVRLQFEKKFVWYFFFVQFKFPLSARHFPKFRPSRILRLPTNEISLTVNIVRSKVNVGWPFSSSSLTILANGNHVAPRTLTSSCANTSLNTTKHNSKHKRTQAAVPEPWIPNTAQLCLKHMCLQTLNTTKH